MEKRIIGEVMENFIVSNIVESLSVIHVKMLIDRNGSATSKN